MTSHLLLVHVAVCGVHGSMFSGAGCVHCLQVEFDEHRPTSYRWGGGMTVTMPIHPPGYSICACACIGASKV